MQYQIFNCKGSLQPWIECFWVVEGNSSAEQKIVPDGFPELIFHFGDPYEILTPNGWQTQSRIIASGQLRKPIYLRAVGNSGVFGVKFKPTGLWKLLGLNMRSLTNQVLPIDEAEGLMLTEILIGLRSATDDKARIKIVENFLLRQSSGSERSDDIAEIVKDIQNNKGMINISELTRKHKITPRKLERLFLQQVGLSAKLYSRLSRFTHVFKLIQQPGLTRSDVTYLSGYFDQPHFNREFRAFTGDNPENYFRQNHAFANFFMNR